MNAERKQELIEQWGFYSTLAGMYYRTIYQDQGYIEQWLDSNPDFITFIKDGIITEQHKINWELFNK